MSVVKRFQKIGVVQPDPKVERSTTTPQTRSDEQRFQIVNVTSRAVGPQPISKASDSAGRGAVVEASPSTGIHSVSPLASSVTVTSLVTKVLADPGIANPGWGGISVAPLYWLDTDHEIRLLGSHNKWSVFTSPYSGRTGTKWSIAVLRQRKMRLSHNGTLAWPLNLSQGR